VVKPVAKAAIKSGILLFEKVVEMIAEAKESVEDLAAEAHAELVQERRSAEAAAQGGGAGPAEEA